MSELSDNIEVKYLILTKIDSAGLIIIIVLEDVQLNKVSEIYYRQVLLLQSSHPSAVVSSSIRPGRLLYIIK